MANPIVKAELRTGKGKSAARRLRRDGRLPAIVYGKKAEQTQISLDEADFRKVLNQGAAGRLVDLDLGEAGKRTVLVKDLQLHPVRGDVLHADFHEVDLNVAVTTTVPLHMTGEDTRENDGGIVTLQLHEVTVSCLPTAIPESIPVDVSGLKIGDSVRVRDLPAVEGVEIVNDPDETVLTVAPPAVAPVEEPAEGAEGAEGGDDEGSEGAGEEG